MDEVGAPPPSHPVAAVLVDVGLPHLDRPFEYLVPAEMDTSAAVGVRVKVRFAGRDVNGFVVDRRVAAEHPGRLAPIRRVVSDEPVLTPTLLRVVRAVADRYAGTVADVLRLAVPPRHAAAEKALSRHPPDDVADVLVEGTSDDLAEAAEPAEAAAAADGAGADGAGAAVPESAPEAGTGPTHGRAPDPGPWSAYPAGPAFLRRVAAGQDPAASWLALPRAGGAQDWPDAFAVAAQAALAGGRGFLLVVPDRRDVDRLTAALTQRIGADRFVRLTADQGPQARYTAWLKLLRGHVPGAVGTRSAAFAPVRRLGLVAWWDDGDDLYEEPRAPYPHTRDVLAVQAQVAGAAMLAGGYVRSVTLASWLADGRVRSLDAPRSVVRQVAPSVALATEGRVAEQDGPAAWAHLPPAAWRTAQAALQHGPVLVQVPRRGYLPALTCQECRSPARCPQCCGPLALGAAGAVPSCRWCGRRPAAAACANCGSTRWRSAVVGHRRTAEELGRAFPSIPVTTSGSSGGVVATVDNQPRLVIATPGAEPVADGGYAGALLLDAWAFLDRPTLDAGQESLRRWMAAAALVRPVASPTATPVGSPVATPVGGPVATPVGSPVATPVADPVATRVRHGSAPRPWSPVVLCGAPEDLPVPAVEALVRWAPDWLADRELTERSELGLPPAAWMAQLTGPRSGLEQARRDNPWPDGAVLGDITAVRADPDALHRMLIRVPPTAAAALNSLLVALRAGGSARKDPSTPLVRVGLADIAS